MALFRFLAASFWGLSAFFPRMSRLLRAARRKLRCALNTVFREGGAALGAALDLFITVALRLFPVLFSPRLIARMDRSLDSTLPRQLQRHVSAAFDRTALTPRLLPDFSAHAASAPSDRSDSLVLIRW